MALPNAVREQAEKANTMIADPASSGQPAAGETVGAPAAGKPVAVVKDDNRAQVLLENERTARERAEQQYRTLQGKYNAEVPRHVEEKRELERKLADSATRLRELEQQVAAGVTQGASSGAQAELSRLLGDDAAARVLEIARAEAKAAAPPAAPGAPAAAAAGDPPAKPATAATPQDAEEAPSADLAQRYEALLNRLVPDVGTINNDPRFIIWLEGRDSLSGQTRYSILQRHHRALDAVRVADVFLTYKEGRELGSRADPLAHLTSPDSSGESPGPPEDTGGKKVWAPSEIDQFYKDCKLGKYRNRKEDRARIEADIIAAGKEGRVQR